MEVQDVVESQQFIAKKLRSYDIQPKLPLPKGVPYILISKFFERCSTQSLRAVLVLYLIEQLLIGAIEATLIYHAVNTVMFMTALLGAIISDCWWGRYRTQLYMGWLFLGSMIVIAGLSIPNLPIPASELSIVAVFLMAIANGVMKPCTVAIGGDQYRLPEQQEPMRRYFAKFYATMKLASILAAIGAPLMRSDVPRLSQAERYTLLWFVLCLAAAVSTLLFVAGSRFYVKTPPAGNRLVLIGKCLAYAIANRRRRRQRSDDHWLDVAKAQYCPELVRDTRILLNIVVVLLPMPMLWALSEQVASSWILQAKRMDGDLGGVYTIKADQMQALTQIFVLALIPVCDWWLYPVMAKCGIRSALQRMIAGCTLAVAAFVAAGGVEYLNELGIGRMGRPMHIAFLLPQYFLISLSETIVGVTGLVFMNTEAPTSLKTSMQAIWLVSHSLGHLINVIVLGVPFASHVYLFLCYAGLMAGSCVCLVLLERRYERIDPNE